VKISAHEEKTARTESLFSTGKQWFSTKYVAASDHRWPKRAASGQEKGIRI
jgi:hypothetical protein